MILPALLGTPRFLRLKEVRSRLASGTFAVIIESFFQRNGGLTRLKGELAVYYWPRVAGIEIAGKVAATRFKDGFLYLQTENSALAHQLSLLNLDIIKKYRKILRGNIVTGIKIKIGAINISLIRRNSSDPEIELNPNEKQMIENCRQSIPEPDLALKFTALMQKHYLEKRKLERDGGKKCRSCEIIIESQFDYCPCCERLVKGEKEAFLEYLKITKGRV
jgi:hypothetical protein